MKSYTVQETWLEWDDPVYDKVGNILLTRIMGGNPIMGGYGYSTTEKDTWVGLEEVRAKGGKPYAIPAGASDHPLGGLGYANFADEVAMQNSSWASSSTTSWWPPVPVPPRPAWWWASPRRKASPRDRHRYRRR
jgi:1-aminocyclopropane-1-carboxylate deaminase/D-cysteine desulfhydrase-like pyridoxal-dependent ACC family enzyme